MPARVKWFLKIPGILERLSDPSTPSLWTTSEVAALLGCTGVSVGQHINAARRAGRIKGEKKAGTWLLTKRDLAKMLELVYETYGGEQALRPLLDLIQESSETEERVVLSQPAMPRHGSKVIIVPEGKGSTIEGPGMFVRGRTARELLEGAGEILNRATASRSQQRALEAELQGRSS